MELNDRQVFPLNTIPHESQVVQFRGNFVLTHYLTNVYLYPVIRKRTKLRVTPGGEMKKEEARRQAERIFLEADGTMTNIEIAKKVGANPLTVGRWKRSGDWAAKLTKRSEKVEGKSGARPVRKKEEHDRALKLYLESQGKIAVRELARRVGVTRDSIVAWKANEHWEERLVSSETVRIEEPVLTVQVREEEKDDIVEIDLDELTCPSHIARLNKKIDYMLGQACLSPTDLKTVAEAKEAVLGVVSAYIGVIKKASDLERDWVGDVPFTG